MTEKVKKFTRSKSDRKIAGICGGIAEYFGVDSTLVRVIYIVVALLSAGFPLLIAYLILWALIPD